jgi:hypothetical protein
MFLDPSHLEQPLWRQYLNHTLPVDFEPLDVCEAGDQDNVQSNQPEPWEKMNISYVV